MEDLVDSDDGGDYFDAGGEDESLQEMNMD
jgi:hypothetical protein